MDKILQKDKNTSISIRISEALKKELKKKVAQKVLALSTPEELFEYSISDLITESIIAHNNINMESTNQN